MKKMIMAGAAALCLVVVGAPLAGAAEGGAPALHGVDGKTFGKVVSDLAKSSPGAVADHVSGR